MQNDGTLASPMPRPEQQERMSEAMGTGTYMLRMQVPLGPQNVQDGRLAAVVPGTRTFARRTSTDGASIYSTVQVLLQGPRYGHALQSLGWWCLSDAPIWPATGLIAAKPRAKSIHTRADDLTGTRRESMPSVRIRSVNGPIGPKIVLAVPPMGMDSANGSQNATQDHSQRV
ncbi:hypothetical protein TrVGV298_011604 [Trichoderma virens]|nr:hypothetical protein TrVGV298_011604 [Trichoderma virens]